MAEEIPVGKITHYYSKLGVGIVELTGPLKVGETVHVKGATTDFTQSIDSLELEHQAVTAAEAGAAVGIKVKEKVRDGDVVYRI